MGASPCGFNSHLRHYQTLKKISEDKKLHAYIVGVSLGDGNLSNPNGRAIRLRISCDRKYPCLLRHIKKSVQSFLPQNRVGIINRKGCVDISVYSNQLTNLLGWQWDQGPKDKQNAQVPPWIEEDINYSKECLRGLLQTDGCIYKDRNYTMINFVATNSTLANNVFTMMQGLGYFPDMQKLRQNNGKIKYTIRLSKNVAQFIKEINYWKA